MSPACDDGAGWRYERPSRGNTRDSPFRQMAPGPYVAAVVVRRSRATLPIACVAKDSSASTQDDGCFVAIRD